MLKVRCLNYLALTLDTALDEKLPQQLLYFHNTSAATTAFTHSFTIKNTDTF